MVYLHVPFCRSFCTYCGFYSEICREGHDSQIFNEYADSVIKEVQRRKDEIADIPLKTIYIGGGTPSVLPLEVLDRVVNAVREAQNHASLEEFTIEVNPEDIFEHGEDYVMGLLDLGVTRISMGVQSFDDGILHWMNRRHDSATAKEAFNIIRTASENAGKDVSLSIDLIFGIPGLETHIWQDTLREALKLGRDNGFRWPDHISAYQLSVEEVSALERMIGEGKCEEISEEICSHQYDMLCEMLSHAGFNHYEVSNFAVSGHEAVHNSAYWERIPYVGIGPGAHSFSIHTEGTLCRQFRSWNTQTLPTKGACWSRGYEELSDEDIRTEKIMLAMRTSKGIDETELRTLCGGRKVECLISSGSLVRYGSGMVRIPEDRFFVSDEIIRELV